MTARTWVRVGAGIAGTAVGLVGGLWLQRSTPGVLACAGFAAIVAVASTVDIQERRIPNRLTYPGLVGAIAVASLSGRGAFTDAVLGALLAGGVMFVLWFLARGRLGLGDVKLSAMAGAFLGAPDVPMYLIVGSGLGTLAGLALLASGRDRRTAFAYGPYLGLGAVIVMLATTPVVS